MKNKWYYPTYLKESHLSPKGRFASTNIPSRSAVVELHDVQGSYINESEDYNLVNVGNNTYVCITDIAKYEELLISPQKN